MIIETIVVGPLETNCYIFADSVTKKAAVIDPGADGRMVKAVLDKQGLEAECVINTHGHGDHIGANDFFNVPVFIHEKDGGCLTNPALNLSAAFGFGFAVKPARRLLKEGDKIPVGGLSLEVIHTPGHTPGGISLKTDGVVFTGDTLFNSGIGRTDLPGASESAIFDSIFDKLMRLDDDTVVYPGHGPSSTIGEERKSNPFLAERPV